MTEKPKIQDDRDLPYLKLHKKELIVASCIIAALLIANLNILMVFQNSLDDVVVNVPQTGYYRYGVKIAHIGARNPTWKTNTPIMDLKNDIHHFVYMNFIGYYNNYRYYTANFSDFTPTNPNNAFIVHSAQKDTRSLPFHIQDNPYNETGMRTMLNFLKVQRCGVAVPMYHEICHLSDGQDIGKNLTGGWHDAGDYNKYSLNTAYTIYNLIETYNLTHNAIDDDENDIPDILDEAKWGLDWLVKMQDDDGGIFNRIFSGFGYWGLPENEDTQRETNTEKYSGTAAAFAAVTAFSSLIFRGFNATYADELLSKSELAFNWLFSNPINFQQQEFGEYPGNNHTIGWAGAELYRATKNSDYLSVALSFLNYTTQPTEYFTNWMDNNLLGLYSLMNNVDEITNTSILNFLIRNYDKIRTGCAINAFGIPNPAQTSWGINSKIMNHFRDAFYLYLFTKNITYAQSCLQDFNWIVGDNPWNVCFISGLGIKNVVYPHTRIGRTINGGVVPGPIAYSRNSTYYIDTYEGESWKFNEYTIDSNSEALLCYTLLANTSYFLNI
jgi:endoglucanase